MRFRRAAGGQEQKKRTSNRSDKSEDEEREIMSSTYNYLEALPSGSHLGVGRRDKIPQWIPSMMANGVYMFFLFAILAGYEELMFRVLPYLVAGSAISIYGFWRWVKSRYEDLEVHRFGLYMCHKDVDGKAKIMLGDFLADPEKQSTMRVGDIHAAAEEFESEGWVALARAQSMGVAH